MATGWTYDLVAGLLAYALGVMGLVTAGQVYSLIVKQRHSRVRQIAWTTGASIGVSWCTAAIQSYVTLRSIAFQGTLITVRGDVIHFGEAFMLVAACVSLFFASCTHERLQLPAQRYAAPIAMSLGVSGAVVTAAHSMHTGTHAIVPNTTCVVIGALVSALLLGPAMLAVVTRHMTSRQRLAGNLLLALAMSLCLYLVTANATLSATPSPDTPVYNSISTDVWQVILASTIGFTLLACYSAEREVSLNRLITSVIAGPLEMQMALPAVRSAIEQAADAHYCREAVDFFQRVCERKHIYDPVDKFNATASIIDEFIRLDGTTPINISHNAREELLAIHVAVQALPRKAKPNDSDGAVDGPAIDFQHSMVKSYISEDLFRVPMEQNLVIVDENLRTHLLARKEYQELLKTTKNKQNRPSVV